MITKKYSGIDSPYNYGEVLHTGYVDTALLLERYRDYLVSNNLFVKESFDYELLEVIPGVFGIKVGKRGILFLQRVLGCIVTLILRIYR